MENSVSWHYKSPDKNQLEEALKQIKMRNTFINTLVKQARIDEKIILIVGDLGFNVVEPFQSEFPKRFINAGICEQIWRLCLLDWLQRDIKYLFIQLLIFQHLDVQNR